MGSSSHRYHQTLATFPDRDRDKPNPIGLNENVDKLTSVFRSERMAVTTCHHRHNVSSGINFINENDQNVHSSSTYHDHRHRRHRHHVHHHRCRRQEHGVGEEVCELHFAHQHYKLPGVKHQVTKKSSQNDHHISGVKQQVTE